jgi:anti-sigma factor RsiW
MTCEEVRNSLGAYVLGGLEPEEAAAVRAHLEQCPECAREYAQLKGLPDMLDLIEAPDDALQRPAPGLEEAILDRHARERRALREERAKHGGRERSRGRLPSLRTRRGQVVAGVAAALATAAVVAVLVTGGESTVNPPAAAAAVLNSGPAAPRAHGTAWLKAVPAGTSVRVRALGLPGGKAFELWCIRYDGRWVSAGTFRAMHNGTADVRLTAAVRSGEYGRILVTPRDSRQPTALRGLVMGY